jgi:hypothetical protein
MHPHRTAAARFIQPSPWSRRVRGLGVCDALELSLTQQQLPLLLGEIDARRIAHEQTVRELIRRDNLYGLSSDELDDEVERHQRELLILAAIREQARAGDSRSVSVCGPAPQVSALVHGAMVSAADALQNRADDRSSTRSLELATRVVDAAVVAHAWAETLRELVALEWFTIELGD